MPPLTRLGSIARGRTVGSASLHPRLLDGSGLRPCGIGDQGRGAEICGLAGRETDGLGRPSYVLPRSAPRL